MVIQSVLDHMICGAHCITFPSFWGFRILIQFTFCVAESALAKKYSLQMQRSLILTFYHLTLQVFYGKEKPTSVSTDTGWSDGKQMESKSLMSELWDKGTNAIDVCMG